MRSPTMKNWAEWTLTLTLEASDTTTMRQSTCRNTYFTTCWLHTKQSRSWERPKLHTIQHFPVEIWCFTSVGLPHRNSTGVTIENDREPSVTNISTGKHALTPQSHSWCHMVSISILCSRAVKELSSTLTPCTNVKVEMTMGLKCGQLQTPINTVHPSVQGCMHLLSMIPEDGQELWCIFESHTKLAHHAMGRARGVEPQTLWFMGTSCWPLGHHGP